MINLKGVVKKLNLSRFIIHEKLMCVGIRLIISVTFLLLVVSVRLQAQDTKVSHPLCGNLLIIRPIQVLMD